MSAPDKIACSLNRRDEVPNQELARELAETEDKAGIREIAANLWNKNKNIRSDCLKVLYEIGFIKPDLIANCADDFLKLLQDKDNRLIWGAMIGLGTIAERRAGEIWAHIDVVMAAVEQGSVITVVWGVRTLAGVVARKPELTSAQLTRLKKVMKKFPVP